MSKQNSSSGKWELVFLVVLLAVGLGLRLIDLTDPPLDFHADRQLASAIIARGMYYQMVSDIDPAQKQLAIDLWKGLDVYEPPILERMIALTYYVIGSEQLWIARLYSALFWVIGGLALYGLARRMTSMDGGLAALFFYLFMPFGVIVSRSFQPNSFMVMWMLLALYSLYRWAEDRTWKWTLLTGFFVGIAALVKVFAAVMLAPALVAVVLSAVGLRKLVMNRQVWSMAGISIAIPAIYYFFGIGARSSGFFSFWSLSYTNLLFKPRFYFAWLSTAGIVIGISTLFFSLASLMLLSGKGRSLSLGLWCGYGLFGLLVPFQISTHDYYSLSLIPFAALSLSPIFSMVLEKVRLQSHLSRIFFAAVLLLYVVFQAWLIRNTLVSDDFRGEADSWAQMGAELPRDGPIIALTHEYGMRLSYFGFIELGLWPYVMDFAMLGMQNDEQGNGQLARDEFDQYFSSTTAPYRYFLVTRFDELDGQPLLKDKLYRTYPILQEGDGYILFDLNDPFPGSQQP